MREPDKEHLLMHGFAPSAHASVFVASVSVSANSPALVLWRFVCVCVCVRACVFVSAPPTRLYSLTSTPPTLWIMRSNHARHQPYTLYVPTSLPLSLSPSLSLSYNIWYILLSLGLNLIGHLTSNGDGLFSSSLHFSTSIF
jgi:hypothetical protein